MGIPETLSGIRQEKRALPQQQHAKEPGHFGADPEEIRRKIERAQKNRKGIRKLLSHPFDVLTGRPVNIFIVSVPVALFVFFWNVFPALQAQGVRVLYNSTLVDNYLVLAVLISIIPVAILDFYENRRMNNLEVSLPNFFRDIAGMNDSGMTLPSAVHLVAGSEYGALTPHVKKLDNEMSWGVGFVEGMYSFGSPGDPACRAERRSDRKSQ